MRQTQSEVLVVGAGPVGLWTALVLAERGLEVALIDREAKTTARSYACALHPGTLRLLDRLGLAQSAIERGRRIECLAFYQGDQRHAEIHLSKLGCEFPFLLVLPQSALEGLLEQRLLAAGVPVHWNHRFEGFSEETESLSVTVEELEGTTTGYIVPHWETVVKTRRSLHTEFLIGADGHNSMVRPRAGIEYRSVGPRTSFAAFEFETDNTVPDELRVALDSSSVNVLWPLADNRCRWTFQLLRSEPSGDFPEKERRAVRLDQPAIDERIKQYVQKVARERAPWFSSEIKRVHWCTEVAFERRLVSQFGHNRCWLAGDAAHQTGPVGVQSMNLGFAEADHLGSKLQKVLREAAPLELLQSYDADHQAIWRRLLGLNGGLTPAGQPLPWVVQHAPDILPCLPAYGTDLQALAGQLDLKLA